MLRFKKADICAILNTNHGQLSKLLSDEVKTRVNWRNGHQYFTDKQAFEIIKDFRGFASDEMILEMLFPKGF